MLEKRKYLTTIFQSKSPFFIYLCFLSFLLPLQAFAANEHTNTDLWFNGFGPVKFGDECIDKTAKFEIHKHSGFLVKAHCFSYRGIQTGKITSLSIYTNDLTLDSAKRLINQHIRKKDKETDLYWAGSLLALPGSKGDVLWPNRSLPNTTRSVNACITNADNAIEIIEYKDPIKFQKELKYGSLEIKIWANKIRCEEKIKVEQTIIKNKTEQIEKELNTNSAESLLNSFN